MKKKVIVVVWCAISVLLLGAVTVETLNQLYIESRTVSSWGELANDYLVFRSQMGPIVPPSVQYEDVIAGLEKGDLSFLTRDWQFKFSGGTYYVANKSKLSKFKLPLHILVYEDIQRGEIIILSSPDGETYQGEALFNAPEFMPYESDFPLDRYAFDELAPRRVVWEITLKPESEAWNDLVLQRTTVDTTAMLLDGGEMMAMMSVPAEHTNDLWLGINGTELTVFAPDGFTNRMNSRANQPQWTCQSV